MRKKLLLWQIFRPPCHHFSYKVHFHRPFPPFFKEDGGRWISIHTLSLKRGLLPPSPTIRVWYVVVRKGHWASCPTLRSCVQRPKQTEQRIEFWWLTFPFSLGSFLFFKCLYKGRVHISKGLFKCFCQELRKKKARERRKICHAARQFQLLSVSLYPLHSRQRCFSISSISKCVRAFSLELYVSHCSIKTWKTFYTVSISHNI